MKMKKYTKKHKKTKPDLNYFNKLLPALLALTLIAYVIFIISNSIILTQPKDNIIITNRYPEFKWDSNQNTYRLIVDNSPDFNSPIIDVSLTEKSFKSNIKLDLSKYYWKVIGENTGSAVNSFTITSIVAVELEENSTTSVIKNVGNVRTKITTEENRNGFSVIGAVILDINELLAKNKTNQTSFKAEQDE